jgi:hypothetical protein
VVRRANSTQRAPEFARWLTDPESWTARHRQSPAGSFRRIFGHLTALGFAHRLLIQVAELAGANLFSAGMSNMHRLNLRSGISNPLSFHAKSISRSRESFAFRFPVNSMLK